MGRAFEYRKATKFARWDKMAKEFSKAGKHITIAVKQGGADPDTNPMLKRAMQNAKAVQMPKDKIFAAIKKASDKDTSSYEEVIYEGMAAHGVAVIVEAATDNPVRTVSNVRSYFRKKGGSLGTTGMNDFLFDRMGVFYVDANKFEDKDELELELIDFGLESIEEVDEEMEGREMLMLKLMVAFEDFGNIQSALDSMNINVLKSKLDRLPKMFKELGDEEVDEVLALIDLLEQDDDVTNVFHNLG